MSAGRKLFLAILVFSIVNLGHSESTLLFQYALVPLSLLGYALFSGGTFLASAHLYLVSTRMSVRWVFVAWMILSLLWAVSGLALSRTASLLMIYAVCVVAFDAARAHDLTRFAVRTMYYSAAFCAVTTLSGVVKIPVFDRPAGIYGNPNIIALISLAGLAIYLFHNNPYRRRWAVWAWNLLGPVMLASTAVSASRKGVLGALFLFAVSLIGRRARRRLVLLLLIVIPAGAVALVASPVLSARGQLTLGHFGALQRFGDPNAVEDASFQERAEFLQLGLELVAESPLIGHGLEAFRALSGTESYSHNNYLEMLIALGAVGLVLYYGSFIHLLLLSMRRWQRDSEALLFFALLSMMMVLDIGFVSYLFKPWILIYVLAAGHYSRRTGEGS